MIEARGSRRAIRRAYDLFSHFWGHSGARLEREAVTLGLQLAAVQPGEAVLEVAVGAAAAFRRLSPRVGAQGLLVGVDLSRGMLKATRRRVPAARLVQADAQALPFAAEAFDLVWASYLLDLIPTGEMTGLLKEFRRVLRPACPPSGRAGAGRPGGRLVLVNFSKRGPEGSGGLTWWERAYRVTPSWAVPWLFASCRPVEAEAYVRAAGFREVEVRFVAGGLDSEVIRAWK